MGLAAAGSNQLRRLYRSSRAVCSSRDNWKPATKSQFSDGPIGTDDGLRRVLEMVAAAVS